MLARISLRHQLQQMGVLSEHERVEDHISFESTFKNGLFLVVCYNCLVHVKNINYFYSSSQFSIVTNAFGLYCVSVAILYSLNLKANKINTILLQILMNFMDERYPGMKTTFCEA